MNKIISALVWSAFILTTLILFPVSLLIWFLTYPFDTSRKVFHYWLLIHSGILASFLPCGRIRPEGTEKINRNISYVIISNHQSILDILVLNRIFINFKWISKIENLSVPFLGWYLRMAGYIPVERGNRESRGEMIKSAARCLRNNISIMIFPEGTRSPDGNIGFFKTGAFELALMTDKPVLPVIIDGTGRLLRKKSRIFTAGAKITFKILDPVFPGSFMTSNHDELAAAFRKIMTRELEIIRAGEQ
ncbi:MAG: 1-acyl-sn-glycerol-3-phosphate acyltransferase [Bacteroidales bacterium]|nr:1-acyl-sn-glycerol-3-phosphate acyltransferase [Bacteroidales bacterium]